MVGAATAGHHETPAPAPRATRTRAKGDDATPQDSFLRLHSVERNGAQKEITPHDHNQGEHAAPEAVAKQPPSTIGRTRNVSSDLGVITSSLRFNKAGTGTLLRSAPVRRGLRQRVSGDSVSPADEGPGVSSMDVDQSAISGVGARSNPVASREPSAEPISVHDFAPQARLSQPARRPQRYRSRSQLRDTSRPASRQDAPESGQSSFVEPAKDASGVEHLSTQARRLSISRDAPKQQSESKGLLSLSRINRGHYRYASAEVETSENQENLPPPTFKRNRDQVISYLGRPPISKGGENPKQQAEAETPLQHQQPDRKVLGTMSNNTPHRLAPAPPPKMSVLETATATAGASVTKSRKKRSHMVVNGKILTQMGRLGRGGSSDVFLVMAENFKTFALKRVKLDDIDPSTLRGYKGEIHLLERLKNVERVVSLYDWEMNNSKNELLVLMEKGETDLNRLLTTHLGGQDDKFDNCFTRHYWREMLECVKAVHEHDIVHSDLKPANFLLVSGRLKLIDFGIANAIDTDNTVNVHRDTHVGTPNYMSPESITDTNSTSRRPGVPGKDENGQPLAKDIKIGKASDVWSLGCILYQMTYGRPPFAHIANHISRILAITNPAHVIEFPDAGIGGAPIPPFLQFTLRKCLNRDPDKRPTVAELLEDSDRFLHPDDRPGTVLMTEELMTQLIQRIVARCKDTERGWPTDEELSVYPRTFIAKIRDMQRASG
ncbi:Pkinase-domain-containing protein [Piedraia hortae CBS 480.64]|uniref:Pkinase-domain-containing protein n=1 Tax=Piedraia hortae CBS 480.64 TaxID=1314780 RepID=A0A6A7BWG2_9PEZI|nr:Pkinase-domain-containing protein [Piedraia hortae CBS 480.64]